MINNNLCAAAAAASAAGEGARSTEPYQIRTKDLVTGPPAPAAGQPGPTKATLTPLIEALLGMGGGGGWDSLHTLNL